MGVETTQTSAYDSLKLKGNTAGENTDEPGASTAADHESSAKGVDFAAHSRRSGGSDPMELSYNDSEAEEEESASLLAPNQV